MGNPAITLERVGKCYGEELTSDPESWAVRDATLSIFSGQLTVLMGPSGSGKTTLLSIMGGLLAPTEGRVQVCGIALHTCDEAERQEFRRTRVGFVFQSCNLLASLSAQENVAVALSLRRADPSQSAALLDAVGLRDKTNAYPQQLSGGQRQRVAIARAFAGDPAVILADEPTAALDAAQGRRVLDLLRARADIYGTAVVVVTHDPRVRSYADRVIEMEDRCIRRVVRRLRDEAPAITTSSKSSRH